MGARDEDAALKLLGGALRLHTFTAVELARDTGVKLSTTRDFIKTANFLETLGQQQRLGSGRPPNRYRLNRQHRREVVIRLAEVQKHLPPLAETYDGEANPPRALTLLRESVKALNANTDDLWEGSAEVRRAEIHILGLEAALRDRRERGASAAHLSVLSDSLDQAKLELKRFRDCQHVLGIVRNWDGEHEIGSASQLYIERFLESWTAPIGVPELEYETAEGVFAKTPLTSLLDSELGAAGNAINEAFFPSYLLFRLRRAWTHERRDELAHIIYDRLSEAKIGARPAEIARLAVTAAAIDAVETAEPLLRAFLIPGVLTSLGEPGRQIFTRALARLARPSHNSAQLHAAAVCHFLLARPGIDEIDIAILGPAALRAPYANPSLLLNDLATFLYDANGLKHIWRNRITEAFLMRNLALVLYVDDFKILRGHISALLARQYGRALLLALGKRANGALKLRDKDSENGFSVSPSAILAEEAGLGDIDIPLSIKKEARSTFSQLLTELSWEETENYEEKNKIHEEEAEKYESIRVGEKTGFTGQLARRSRPAFHVISGGRS